MRGSLNDILPERISEESEQAIRDLLKRILKGAVSKFVRVMRAMGEKYGPEAVEHAHSLFGKVNPRPADQLGTPEEDLHARCDALEKGCVLSHQWERIIDEPDRVGYRFTKCLWAEIYRELDAADLGLWICEGDDPGIRSFNPKLRCKQTKLLMKGDERCDHVFYVDHSGEDSSA